jgi:DDE superfamily endonuclease
MICRFRPKILKKTAVAMGSIVPQAFEPGQATRLPEPDCLAGFRVSFFNSLTRRGDGLFELCEAVLCADGPVTTLVGLSLAGEHRRGHGGLYDGLANGRIEIDRLRRAVAATPIPRDRATRRITLAVDVSPWLRPDAPTSADRSFCHVYGRGKGSAQMIPGWPYSFVAALETGATSWCALLDVQRISRGEEATVVTATQIRSVVERLAAAGQHEPGDPDILIVFDAGYDITRLAWLLADLPVEVLGRVRSDRVFFGPAPPRRPGTNGRPPAHGPQFTLAEEVTHRSPDADTSTSTDKYGTARARCWNRLHPRLQRRTAWADHDGPLPIIEGSLIELRVDRLPGDKHPKPVWLWHSRPDTTAAETDRCWQAFLRRFDIEHTFRFCKQTLGWTRPKIRTPEQGDRWTWLIVAAHTQLRLARGLTTDLRLPWEKPVTDPARLTPARVRRGFRHLRARTARPASAPKLSRPGPGRPAGVANRHRATRHDVGKPKNTAAAATAAAA